MVLDRPPRAAKNKAIVMFGTLSEGNGNGGGAHSDMVDMEYERRDEGTEEVGRPHKQRGK